MHIYDAALPGPPQWVWVYRSYVPRPPCGWGVGVRVVGVRVVVVVVVVMVVVVVVAAAAAVVVVVVISSSSSRW